MAKGLNATKTKTPKLMKPGKAGKMGAAGKTGTGGKMAGAGKMGAAGKTGADGKPKLGMGARLDKLEKMHKNMKKEHKAISARLHDLDGKGKTAPAAEPAAEPEMHEAE